MTFKLDKNLQPALGSVKIKTSTAKSVTFSYSPIGTFGPDVFGFKVSDNSSPIPGEVYARVFVYITKDGAAPPTPAELLYPANQATDLETDVDLEWSRSTVGGKHSDSLSYQVDYCDKPDFVACGSGKSIEVPKSISNFKSLAQASSIMLGGSGMGLLIFGLVGSKIRRKQLQQAVYILLLAAFLASCSNAAEEATDPSNTIAPNTEVGNITYQLSGLDTNTEYYWRISTVDEDTGLAIKSDIHRFTTR
ncbi:MAG: hypothetical protein LJE85_13700 [Gammaproteobacteria bacterium]|nr:hypothetical protein [Gammaproteobacteria bacterium]